MMASKRKAKANPADVLPSKKSKQNEEEDASTTAFRNDDTEHSILGGLAGGYRITGDEDGQPTSTVFKVPFNDKYIVCEHRAKHESTTQNLKSQRKKGMQDETTQGESTLSSPRLIFTHGAGGGIANPATASFADGFSEIAPVVCFQGTMNLQSRVKTFHAVTENQGFAEALGGRSMGARAAVMTANEMEVGEVKAVVLVSYPLVGGKKDEMRDKILKELDASVNVLFVVGENDKMCDIELLNDVRGEMTARSWLIEVEGADHGMSIKNKRGMEKLRQKTGALAAEWLGNRDQKKTRCLVAWDDDASEVVGGEWLKDDNRENGSAEAEHPPKRTKKTKR